MTFLPEGAGGLDPLPEPIVGENAVVRPIVAVKTLLDYMGEDITREGLRETPLRYVKALEKFVSGYGIDPVSVLKVFRDGSEGTDEMVLQTDIPVWSLCEHHILPFFGVAHVGYVPGDGIVGLSKFARLIDVLSRRLQVQERLTTQIADALVKGLEPKGVGVVLECRHTCMESRGVQVAGTVTKTSALRGVFRDDPSARSEFLSLARTKKPL